MSNFRDYDSKDLEVIDNIISSQLTDGSKLSLVVAEYHKLYAINQKLNDIECVERIGYEIRVPAEKLERIASEVYAEETRAQHAADVTKWRDAYDNLRKSVKTTLEI